MPASPSTIFAAPFRSRGPDVYREEIPEVVSTVISLRNDPSSDPKQNHTDLVSLALTSRQFLDPALNALWAVQRSPYAFLRCFPEDAIRLDRRNASLLRPILPSDWTRPSFYTHRIRDFQSNRLFNDPSVLVALVLSSPNGDILFPALQALTWGVGHVSDEAAAACIHVFLPRTLRYLKIESSHYYLASLLPSLPAKLPSLQQLVIKTASVPLKLTLPCTSALIERLQNCALTSLELNILQWEDLMHLSRLDNLRSLTIQEFHGEHDASGVDVSASFPALQTLSIAGCQIQDMTRLLESADPEIFGPQVIHLELRPGANLEAEIPALFETLVSHCKQSQLVDLRTIFSVGTRYPSRGTQWARVPLAALQHLSILYNLRKLTISGPGGFELTDAALGLFLESCSNLEELCLVEPSPLYPTLQPTLTLAALRDAVANCPQLRVFGASIDTRFDLPALPATATATRTAAAIAPKTLEFQVYNSTMGTRDVTRVARFLSNLDRSVVLKADQKEDLEFWNQGWRKVAELLPEFLAVREEERVRWSGGN
ncbi:hypothetical protein HMN09_00927600 [Mycena chlorophos]|uniref:F-box domain-containing protein n=1 Tax=Mycena chlorophos TaxID=658473 RepID=A0A8H6SJD7_MYCCL|nr:hypothetical protein HMN09_00927600 [Mycena chlorophos]